MDWQEMVVRRTLEGAGEHADVQLHFLLLRLERHPETIAAIADAIDDMGGWLRRQAEALEREGTGRSAEGAGRSAEVVNLRHRQDEANGGEV